MVQIRRFQIRGCKGGGYKGVQIESQTLCRLSQTAEGFCFRFAEGKEGGVQIGSETPNQGKRREGGGVASERASERARKQASKEARKQGSERASEQASQQASKQASMLASMLASKQACK